MYMVLAIVFLGIMFLCAFIIGGIFTKNLIIEALDEARRERKAEDYYRLAGCKTESDPKPYVPPTLKPRTPRARMIPHMNALNRLLKEGKRGTIMVRAGDRYKK